MNAAIALTAVLFCSRIGPVVPEEMVAQSDMIVRATAVAAEKNTVRFRVDEVVKGRHSPAELALPGSFDPHDDFNELPVPYHFVRRQGRGGSCYASLYREGAEYLLLLQLRSGGSGDYTVNWYPLGPTNEQLHSKDDPWIVWVRAQVRGSR